jgi:hypothetical protein
MKKKLEYKFDHKRKIIIDTVSGILTLHELIEHEKAKFNDPEYNDSYSAVLDIRGSVFDLNHDEKEIFYRMIKKLTAKINMKRKCAIITDKPNEVVNSQLFKIRMNHISPMNFRIFSSEEAAYMWVT